MLQVSTRGCSAADPLTAHGGLRQVNGIIFQMLGQVTVFGVSDVYMAKHR